MLPGPAPRHAVVLLGLLFLLVLPAAPAGRSAVRAEQNLTGQILVATEDLADPRFARTVVYVVRHDANGALGLVVNRPVSEVPLANLLRQLHLDDQGVTGDIRIHYGGPVEPGAAFLLHSREYATAGTERIAGDIALTPLGGKPVALEDIGHRRGPQHYLFALGYAGWTPGQLENEIDVGAWITVPADEALLFDDDYARKWERAMARRPLKI
jgi:putative transcriptional regulator